MWDGFIRAAEELGIKDRAESVVSALLLPKKAPYRSYHLLTHFEAES